MSQAAAASDFASRIALYQKRVDDYLLRVLPDEAIFPQRLHAAMRYSVLGGGKRMRPLLTYACGEVLQTRPARLDAAATAVELIHAFSLVHDDLPAMDDDDLRRGRATTHKAFDEATAILAGDALQVLAFNVLANDEALVGDAQVQIDLVATLSDATGSVGMTGGQALDLASAGHDVSLSDLETMHDKKTGLLIRAAVSMACLCAPAVSNEERVRLDEFAQRIGRAFQIRDDILDVEGDTTVIGKAQGADIAMNKATYPAILGMDEAKRRASRLYDEALAALDGLARDTTPLRYLAAYIVRRDH